MKHIFDQAIELSKKIRDKREATPVNSKESTHPAEQEDTSQEDEE